MLQMFIHIMNFIQIPPASTTTNHATLIKPSLPRHVGFDSGVKECKPAMWQVVKK